MKELINACIYLIYLLHGVGENDGISLNDSSRFMNLEVVSRVGAGGFHVSSTKKNLDWWYRGGCGREHQRFKYLRVHPTSFLG
jgi:hypothetical protein